MGELMIEWEQVWQQGWESQLLKENRCENMAGRIDYWMRTGVKTGLAEEIPDSGKLLKPSWEMWLLNENRCKAGLTEGHPTGIGRNLKTEKVNTTFLKLENTIEGAVHNEQIQNQQTTNKQPMVCIVTKIS